MEYLYRWRGTVVAPWGTFVPGSEGPSTMEYLCLGGRGLEHHRVPLSLGIMPLSLAADGRGTIENVCLWQWKAGATLSTFVSGGGPLSLAKKRRSTMEYLCLEQGGAEAPWSTFVSGGGVLYGGRAGAPSLAVVSSLLRSRRRHWCAALHASIKHLLDQGKPCMSPVTGNASLGA